MVKVMKEGIQGDDTFFEKRTAYHIVSYLVAVGSSMGAVITGIVWIVQQLK